MVFGAAWWDGGVCRVGGGGGGGAECLLLWLERCWAGLGWAGCMDEEAGESDRGCCEGVWLCVDG